MSARSAWVRLSTRADPKKTTVAWTFWARNRLTRSGYSARILSGMASVLSREVLYSSAGLARSSIGLRGSGRRDRITDRRSGGMLRPLVGLRSGILVVSVMATAARADRAAPQGGGGNGWTLPDDAKTTKNPLTVDAKLVEAGKALFKS